MPTESEDIELRCKTCAKQLGDVTARLPQADHSRVLSSVRWALGLIRCGDCMNKERA